MKIMNINDKQQEVLNYPLQSGKNVAILAGAGAGKTQVLVEKIRQVKEPHLNMLITFTKKAANEFIKRLNLEVTPPRFGTLHSVFAKMLKYDYTLKFIGINNFQDDLFKIQHCKIMEEAEFNDYINYNFNNNMFNEDFSRKLNIQKLEKMIESNLYNIKKFNNIKDFCKVIDKEIVTKYQYAQENLTYMYMQQKLKDKVLNFTDILIYSYIVFKEAKIKLDNIFVDEFQDMNPFLVEILNLFEHKGIFFVGDIYQSIYKFNGANFNFVYTLLNNSNTDVIQLDTNYRSTKNIVDFSNRFIQKNMIDKIENFNEIKAYNKDCGNKIEIFNDGLAFKNLLIMLNKYHNDIEDTIVLSRNNTQLENLKKELTYNNISIKYKAKNELFFMLATLFLYKNELLKIEEINDFEYFKNIEIKNMLDTDINNCNVADFINEFKNNTNFVEYFVNVYKNKSMQLENECERFKNYFAKVDIKTISFSKMYIDRFVKVLKNYYMLKKYENVNGLNVSTIHKVKGLEFNNVIVYNFKEDFEEEEKRIFYVAITRAKNNLSIINDINNKCSWINDFDKDLVNYNNFENNTLNNDFVFNNNEIEIKDINTKDFIDFKEALETITNDIKNNENEKIFMLKSFNYLNNAQFIENNALNNVIKIKDINEFKNDYVEFFDNNYNLIKDKKLKEYIMNVNEITNHIDVNVIDFEKIDTLLNYLHITINTIDTIKQIKTDKKLLQEFKKICKNILKYKYNNKNLNLRKKIFKKLETNFEENNTNNNIDTIEDAKYKFKKDFYIKSENNLRYFIANSLCLYNTKTKQMLIDMSDPKNRDLKRKLETDYDITNINGNVDNKGFCYDIDLKTEKLKGQFLMEKMKNKATQKIAKILYLEHYNINSNAYFLTFTLPSAYHKMKTNKKTKMLVENPKFEQKGENFIEHIVNAAYKINEIYDYFYHTLKTDIDNIKKRIEKKNNIKLDKIIVDFVKQLEPHKNLTPHLHALVWIPQIVGFEREFENVLDGAFKKTKTKYDLKEVKKVDIENMEIEEKAEVSLTLIKKENELINGEKESKLFEKLLNKEINEEEFYKKTHKIAKASSYVLKYILKNSRMLSAENGEFDMQNYNNIEFFNSYINLFADNVKAFSCSNFRYINKKELDLIYNFFKENDSIKLKCMKKMNTPIFVTLEKMKLENKFDFEYERYVKSSFQVKLHNRIIHNVYVVLKNNVVDIKSYFEDFINKKEITNEDYENIENEINILRTNNNIIDVDNKVLYKIATNIILNVNSIDFNKYNTYKKLEVFKKDREFVNKYYAKNVRMRQADYENNEFGYIKSRMIEDFKFSNVVITNSKSKWINENLCDKYIKIQMDLRHFLNIMMLSQDTKHMHKLDNYYETFANDSKSNYVNKKFETINFELAS